MSREFPGGSTLGYHAHPPVLKLCAYRCGRLTSGSGSHTCVQCALHPPCTCKTTAHRPIPHPQPRGGTILVRSYMGQWLDLRCGLLMRSNA